MYTENHPLTGEAVNIYADNIPAVEGTALDVAYPVRKQHTVLKREELYEGTLEQLSDREILDPENYNDVLEVLVANPIVKAEDGKIDPAIFELILERPLEPVSEEANKIIYASEEPEVLEVAEDGSLTAKVELGQAYVTCQWPSGAIARILVTIGEVSEVIPAEPVLDGDVVKPETPEAGEDDSTIEPEPEDPSTEEEPVVEAKIMYGLMPIADHMTSIDAITAEDLEGVEYTEVEVAPLDKTTISVNENDILVILIPSNSELVATRDNGVGTKEAFAEDVIGCNGQKTYTVNGNEYKLYAEFQTIGASDYSFYVD